MWIKSTQWLQNIPVWKYSGHEFKIVTRASKKEIISIIRKNIIDDFQISFLHDKNYFYGDASDSKFWLKPVRHHHRVPHAYGRVITIDAISIVYINIRLSFWSKMDILIPLIFLIICLLYFIQRSINLGLGESGYIIIPIVLIFAIFNFRNITFNNEANVIKARLIKLLGDKSDSDAKVV